jgi:probable addiction module antidote protein
MALKTVPFDAAEFLDTEEAQAAYLSEILAGGDPALVAQAIGTVARARGMTEIAKAAGLGRESLYKALSPDGNPQLATILKVLGALGFRLTVEAPKEAA